MEIKSDVGFMLGLICGLMASIGILTLGLIPAHEHARPHAQEQPVEATIAPPMVVAPPKPEVAICN